MNNRHQDPKDTSESVLPEDYTMEVTTATEPEYVCPTHVCPTHGHIDNCVMYIKAPPASVYPELNKVYCIYCVSELFEKHFPSLMPIDPKEP